MCSRLKAVGMVTFSSPRGLVLRRLTKSSASSHRLRMSTTRLKYPAPVSVSVRCRVVRWNKRAPRRSSSWLMRLDTTAGRKAHLAAGGRHVAGAGDACEYVEITDGSHLSPVGEETPTATCSRRAANEFKV